MKPSIDSVGGPRFWKRVIVALLLLGTYTNYAVDVGVLLYGFVPLVLGTLLLLDHAVDAVKRVDYAALLLVLVCMIDIGGSAFPERAMDLATATLQLVASIVAGTGLLFELRRWPRALLARWCVTSVVIVLGLGALESFTPLGWVSDEVRSRLYSSEGQFLYDASIRDITLHGRVRPKVFTQEPSHPARFVAVAITCWYLLSRHRNRFWIALAASAVGLFVLLSPTLFIAPVLVVFFAVVHTSESHALVKYACAAGFVVLNATVSKWASLLPGTRAAAVAQGLDASTISRVEAPLEVTRRVLMDNPLFGLGIGGKEHATDMLLDVYSGFAAIKMQIFLGPGEYGWGNALFQLLACCGVLGSVLFFAWMVGYCRSLGVTGAASVVMVMFVIFAAEGPFNIARPWVYSFLVVACMYVRTRDAERITVGESGSGWRVPDGRTPASTTIARG